MLGALHCDKATKCSELTDQLMQCMEAGCIQSEDSAHARLTRFLRFGAISALNLKVYLAVLFLQGSTNTEHATPDWSSALLATCQALLLKQCCRAQWAYRLTVTVTFLLEDACQ